MTGTGAGVSTQPRFAQLKVNVKAQARKCNMTPQYLSGDAYRPKPRVDRQFIADCVESDGRKVLLLGDSFANAISTHVAYAAMEIGYEFKLIFGYNCPYPLDFRNVAFNAVAACDVDPSALQTELLKDVHRGDIVVLRLYFPKAQYIGYSDSDLQQWPGELLAAYDVEIASLHQRIAEKGAAMLLIGSNPTVESSPICSNPQWFNRSQHAACSVLQLRTSLPTRFAFHHDLHLRDRFSGNGSSLRVIAPTLLFCDAARDACSLSKDGEFLWSDNHHIVGGGVDLFYPEMLSDLRDLAGAAK
ncbi:MAG: SGNH hydrolase domain-containing protein [Pseudomonadota bacterium]